MMHWVDIDSVSRQKEADIVMMDIVWSDFGVAVCSNPIAKFLKQHISEGNCLIDRTFCIIIWVHESKKLILVRKMWSEMRVAGSYRPLKLIILCYFIYHVLLYYYIIYYHILSIFGKFLYSTDNTLLSDNSSLLSDIG